MAEPTDRFLRATITKRIEVTNDLWVIRVNPSDRHPEMIERGKAILHRHRWEKDALKEERYFVPAPIRA